MTAVLAVGLIASQMAEAVARGVRISARGAAPVLLATALGLAAVLILAYSGFVDKTVDRFSNDLGSASTRVTMFALLAPISLSDLLLSPDHDVVATLQRVYGLEFGIESSWIGLALTYGIIIAAMLSAGLLAFWRSVLRAGGRGGIVVCIFHLVLVSVTASLSGKTTTLAMVITLVVLFLSHDSRPPRASGASIESSVHGLA